MNGQPSKTGMWISGAMHAGLLALIVFGFAFAPKFDDATESLAVDTVTQNQFNEIMKGERDGKPMKEPPPTPAPKPAAEAPPPPPPPPELRTADAPPPPPIETPVPKQEPAKQEAAPPAPPPKPTAEDAPATTPAPPVRPKDTSPPKPKPEVAKPEMVKPDAMAKLIEKAKDDPPPKPQKTEYDPNAIAKLIGDNKTAKADPTPTASTPRGLQSQNAPRMSPSLSAALDAWLTDAYLSCWTPPPSMPEGERYVAQVQVQFNADGSLAAPPALVNPPGDPAWRPHAESAVRAVMKCNPLRVPSEYAPYFDQWRTKNIHFDPASALG